MIAWGMIQKKCYLSCLSVTFVALVQQLRFTRLRVLHRKERKGHKGNQLISLRTFGVCGSTV
jgi:hypothetical protein